MQTIITKALTDCNIKALPSRRCFTLMKWIEERLETVYKKDPRFSDKAQSLFTLDLGAPEVSWDNNLIDLSFQSHHPFIAFIVILIPPPSSSAPA